MGRIAALRGLVGRKLGQGSFLRSVGSVGGAAGISQLAGLAAMPLLTRLYSESDIGASGALLAYANIVAAGLLLGLPDAALSTRNDDDARRLTLGGLVIAVAAIPLVAMLTAWMIDGRRSGLGALPLSAVIPATLLVLVLVAFSHVQTQLIRARQFGVMARGYLELSLIRVAAQLVGGFAALGYGGMIGGELVSRAVASADMARTLWSRPRIWHGDRMRHLVDALRRYRRFLLFRTPSTLLSAVAVGLPALLMIQRHGAAQAGYFNLAAMMLLAPAALIQKAVGDVFIGHFAHQIGDDRKAALLLLWRTAGLLVILAAVGTLALWLLAPWAFATAFGDGWLPAGEMAARCAPWFAAMVLVAPLSQILVVMHRPELKLIYDAAFIALLLGADNFATSNHAQPLAYVTMIAAASAAAYLMYIPLMAWSVARPGVSAAPRAR